MDDWYLSLALFLLLNLVAGFFRILRGPTPADSMLAAQLFGTTCVAILILLAQAMNRPALRDIALVFALLAVVSIAAFISRFWVSEPEKGDTQ